MRNDHTMRQDRYGYELTTDSAAAADAYIEGVDRLLSAEPEVDLPLLKALEADDGFALAHLALARAMQMHGRGSEVKAPLGRALALAPMTTEREQSQIRIFEKILTGQGLAAIPMIEAHVKTWPRDAMVVAPATGVFGLIGFSGQAGREERQLAFLEPLATHYGDDWWFLTVLAFAEVELQHHESALRNIGTALAIRPRNAHAAHIRAHLFYEMGEREEGLPFLTDWYRDYPRSGQLHCHISWHLAIWSMESGQRDEAWRIFEDAVFPGGSWGPAINTLTDGASFMLRAELAGEARRPEMWRKMADFAAEWFPATGVTFADVHSALAYAMAGDAAALKALTTAPKGPAADLLAPIADGFDAFAQGDWQRAAARIETVLESHERIGGSRAQRDLLEYTVAYALARSGEREKARRQIVARRPQDAREGLPLAGL